MTNEELHKAGGQAFPTKGYATGASLRDWFAAKAMQGIIAAHSGDHPLPEEAKVAKWAYDYADSMLKQREAPKPAPAELKVAATNPAPAATFSHDCVDDI